MALNKTQNPNPSRPTPRRRWLCVAYAFPPINRSGTHRTLAFVKHLDRLGWDANVLTVEPGNEPLDQELLSQLPPSAQITRTRWIDPIQWVKGMIGRSSSIVQSDGPVVGPRSHSSVLEAPRRGLRDWATRLLITPDSRTGWVMPAVRAGMATIRSDRPDVIYSTSPYASAHLIAMILAWRARLPWVADFRDPWGENPFRHLVYPSIEGWDRWLERRVLKRASHIVCNTPTMTSALIRRCPFVADKCTTILNGIDRDRLNDVTPQRVASDGTFVLTHCGQFYGPRSPGVWLRAIRRVCDESPEVASRLRMVLVGDEWYEGRSLREWVREAGVHDVVSVIGKKSHAESLAIMAGSDALMLAGGSGVGGELQVPNKLYEYLALGRPIVATCVSHSPIRQILRDAKAVAIACDPTDEKAVASAIVKMATGQLPELPDAWSGASLFDRSRRAAELAAVFDAVTGGPASIWRGRAREDVVAKCGDAKSMRRHASAKFG